MSLDIDVLTIFPDAISEYCAVSILGIAQESELISISVHDIRDATVDRHRSVDDAPFGGGAGMVMKPEPIFETVESHDIARPLYYLSPTGRTFDQRFAQELVGGGGFSLLCGRYEGVDERVRTDLIDGEISLGDFVLAGGELGALAVIETCARLVPGVLGNELSVSEETFEDDLLEYPHFTRPATFRDLEVPEVLLSGDHARIARWRRAQALHRTVSQRPDLIERRGGLTPEEEQLLADFNL